MSGTTRVADLLRQAATRLAEAGVPSPRTDAELLVAHAARASRADVQRAALLGRTLDALVGGAGAPGANAIGDDVAGAGERVVDAGSDGLGPLVEDVLARRAAREPLQHITGLAPFRRTELAVGPGVFVPRPETEAVAEVALEEARAVVRRSGSALVVDLCTGSGAIALAIADEVPGAQVHAVELDADAYAWARRNVEAAAVLPRAGGAVRLVRGDARTALAELDGRCDVVVSNPPYVPSDAVPRDPEVAHHDPEVALYGLGPDGLEVPRGVAAAAARLLAPGGLFVMEHAEVQAEDARRLLEACGFADVRTVADLTGRDRMAVGRCGGGVSGDPRGGPAGSRRAVSRPGAVGDCGA
ncbi:peptide chain release factor N(5)-glutamine methyltransferase [Paraoerskovia sediminicola]|uniref:peptide chain release factor N(5)-glutamine methyltransferase n=1 Tax=Paraoerskovia sediminicola TaxID=1138587 RepID=UPI002572B9FF|nr:peptide chain release factor N(5)-glutamine methyltransferase [Paraoerskovia sediminicola]